MRKYAKYVFHDEKSTDVLKIKLKCKSTRAMYDAHLRRSTPSTPKWGSGVPARQHGRSERVKGVPVLEGGVGDATNCGSGGARRLKGVGASMKSGDARRLKGVGASRRKSGDVPTTE